MSRCVALSIVCLAGLLLGAVASAQSSIPIAAPGECAAPLFELETEPAARGGGGPPSEEPPGGVGGAPGDLFGVPRTVDAATAASLSTSGAVLDPQNALLPSVDALSPESPLDPELDPLPLDDLGGSLLGSDG